MYGNVEKIHFDDEYLNNPTLIELLLKKIKVVVNGESDKRIELLSLRWNLEELEDTNLIMQLLKIKNREHLNC